MSGSILRIIALIGVLIGLSKPALARDDAVEVEYAWWADPALTLLEVEDVVLLADYLRLSADQRAHFATEIAIALAESDRIRVELQRELKCHYVPSDEGNKTLLRVQHCGLGHQATLAGRLDEVLSGLRVALASVLTDEQAYRMEISWGVLSERPRVGAYWWSSGLPFARVERAIISSGASIAAVDAAVERCGAALRRTRTGLLREMSRRHYAESLATIVEIAEAGLSEADSLAARDRASIDARGDAVAYDRKVFALFREPPPNALGVEDQWLIWASIVASVNPGFARPASMIAAATLAAPDIVDPAPMIAARGQLAEALVVLHEVELGRERRVSWTPEFASSKDAANRRVVQRTVELWDPLSAANVSVRRLAAADRQRSLAAPGQMDLVVPRYPVDVVVATLSDAVIGAESPVLAEVKERLLLGHWDQVENLCSQAGMPVATADFLVSEVQVAMLVDGGKLGEIDSIPFSMLALGSAGGLSAASIEGFALLAQERIALASPSGRSRSRARVREAIALVLRSMPDGGVEVTKNLEDVVGRTLLESGLSAVEGDLWRLTEGTDDGERRMILLEQMTSKLRIAAFGMRVFNWSVDEWIMSAGSERLFPMVPVIEFEELSRFLDLRRVAIEASIVVELLRDQ